MTVNQTTAFNADHVETIIDAIKAQLSPAIDFYINGYVVHGILGFQMPGVRDESEPKANVATIGIARLIELLEPFEHPKSAIAWTDTHAKRYKAEGKAYVSEAVLNLGMRSHMLVKANLPVLRQIMESEVCHA